MKRILIDFDTLFFGETRIPYTLAKELIIECQARFGERFVALVSEDQDGIGIDRDISWKQQHIPFVIDLIFLPEIAFLADESTLLISNSQYQRQFFKTRKGQAISIQSKDDFAEIK